MIRKTLYGIISMILVLFIIGGLKIIQKPTPSAKFQLNQNGSNKEALDFTLPDIYGNSLSLSDFKGKVVLIDFWATWCPVCRESIPILQSLYADYKDKGLVIVGITLEQDGGKTLKRFAKEKEITYPLLLGNERLARAYSVFGVPTRFLINRQGEIVERFIGFQDRDTLKSAIEKLL